MIIFSTFPLVRRWRARNEIAVPPRVGPNSPAAIHARLEQRVAAMSDPTILYELKGDGVKIDFYDNGKIIVWFKPVYNVRMNTGEGPRENTQTLYGFVELTPRPATGTRHLAGPSAPTQMHGGD